MLVLPSMDGIMALPDHNSTALGSSWVYNSEDKISLGLYPLGIEVHSENREISHPRPLSEKDSSFAAPKFAKVKKRPQRAHTFIVRNDPFSLHGETCFMRLHPISAPQLPKHSPQRNRVQRSVSLSNQSVSMLGLATLSRKYQAFSLSKHTGTSILELGSPNIGKSNDYKKIPVELPKSAVKEKPLNKNQVKNRPFPMTAHRLKGPAPLPPKQSQKEIECIKSKLKLLVDSKEHCINSYNDSCSSSEFDRKKDSLNSSQWNYNHQTRANQVYNKIIKEQSPSDSQISPSVQEIVKPPRLIRDKIKEQTSLIKDELKSKIDPLNSIVNCLSEIDKPSSSNLETTNQQRLKIINNHKAAYEEAIEDENAPLEFLPSLEVQKNKIILRVRSFKNTGCQTETYHPIRRRASCSSGHAALTSLYFPSEEQRVLPEWHGTKIVEEQERTAATSTSSSGYSSPDGESREAYTVQSSPPSPGSCYESGTEESKPAQFETNVTVIEVNKHHTLNTSSKFSRARPLSDASTLAHKVYGIPNDFLVRSSTFSQSIYDSPSFRRKSETIPENAALLTDSIDHTLMHQRPASIPRVVDAIIKPYQFSVTGGTPSIATKEEVENNLPPKQYLIPQPLVNLKGMKEGILGSINSTAAYLASLELLATHYRQQALANAQQLQMQQNMHARKTIKESKAAHGEPYQEKKFQHFQEKAFSRKPVISYIENVPSKDSNKFIS